MRIVLALTVRNLRLYFRDRLGVFFSLLGALILFLLYMLFLRELQTSGLRVGFPDADPGTVSTFVDTWMFAGIISITTFTTGLGAFASFVDDSATGRFRDFRVSPIGRGELVLGYLLSSFIVAVAMSLFVLAVSLGYLFFVDGLALEPGRLATLVAEIVLSCIAFAALSAFVVSFVSTPGAFSALATVVGTTLGFLAGAYIPVGLFPEGVRSVINALPFGQSATLLRQQLSQSALDELVAGQAAAVEQLSTYYGITAKVGSWEATPPYIVSVLTGMVVVFALLAAVRIRRRLR